MYKLLIASLLAAATALPIEDTADVAAAKAEFNAAFAAAEAGEHAALAPVNLMSRLLRLLLNTLLMLKRLLLPRLLSKLLLTTLLLEALLPSKKPLLSMKSQPLLLLLLPL